MGFLMFVAVFAYGFAVVHLVLPGSGSAAGDICAAIAFLSGTCALGFGLVIQELRSNT